jgi:hypothetical protein
MIFLRDKKVAGLTPELELQIKICKLLGVGFVLSIFPIAGVGSLAALLLGLQVRRLMKSAKGPVGGAVLMWWCIFAGAAGSLFLIQTISLLLKPLP